MKVFWIIFVVIVIAWPVCGIVLHHFLYARKEFDYNILGYALSVFPGPFVPVVLWREGR